MHLPGRPSAATPQVSFCCRRGQSSPQMRLCGKRRRSCATPRRPSSSPWGGNRFHIRYFTPAAEVELCGHATIGSFHALQEMGLVAEGGTYIDETLSGTLEVVVGKDAILMDMAKPQTFQRLETPEELEELYRIMGLSADGQGAVTGKPELMLLPQKVSTGLDGHHDARGR